MKNYKQSSGLQRSKSQRVGPTDLKKRPLKFRNCRNNATLEAKYANMKFVKMEVKRSSYGRQVKIQSKIRKFPYFSELFLGLDCETSGRKFGSETTANERGF